MGTFFQLLPPGLLRVLGEASAFLRVSAYLLVLGFWVTCQCRNMLVIGGFWDALGFVYGNDRFGKSADKAETLAGRQAGSLNPGLGFGGLGLKQVALHGRQGDDAYFHSHDTLPRKH